MTGGSLADILKRNLLWYIGITVMVCVALLTTFQIVQLRKAAANEDEAMLDLVESQILLIFGQYEQDLALVDTLIATDGPQVSVPIAQDAVEAMSFRRVDILDANGMLIGSIPPEPYRIGFDLSQSDGYRLASRSEDTYATGNLVFDSDSGRNLQLLTKKSRHGYLVGFFDSTDLQALFGQVRVADGYLAITDASGKYVAHTLDRLVSERQIDPHFKQLDGGIFQGSLVRYDGSYHFIRYARLYGSNLTILSYRSATSHWQVLVGTILSAFTVLLTMALILRFVVTRVLRHMNGAILDLRTATENIANGIYTHDVSKDTYRELLPLIDSFLRMSQDVQVREEEVARLHQEREDNFLSTITLMAKAIEAKDQYTGDHCERVRTYALMLGHALELDEDALRSLTFGSILHDIGKIGIEEQVLNKPGRLNEEEYARIKEHCRIGARILGDVPFLRDTQSIILSHHEAVDGSGYPNGLRGEAIPLLARIVAIADAFDAMTSSRPYRSTRMTEAEAVAELERCAGTQFSEDLVRVFVESLRPRGG